MCVWAYPVGRSEEESGKWNQQDLEDCDGTKHGDPVLVFGDAFEYVELPPDLAAINQIEHL